MPRVVLELSEDDAARILGGLILAEEADYANGLEKEARKTLDLRLRIDPTLPENENTGFVADYQR